MTKPYKCRVEYLEATGTQYIDTGIIGNGEFDVDYIYRQTQESSNAIFAGTRSASQHLNLGQRSTGTGGGFSLAYLGNFWIAGSTPSINTDIRVQISYKIGSQSGSLNGTALTGNTLTGTEVTNLSIYLFKRNHYGTDNVDGLVGRIYYFKLWKDGALVRDYIPVLDNSGRPAMYDQVSGQLFYNQGSGDDFTYGRQIIPVEYLESSGTNEAGTYIDTGYYPNNNTRVEFIASGISAESFTISSGSWFLGGRQAYQDKMFGFYYNQTNQTIFFSFSTSQGSSSYSSSLMYGKTKKFVLDKTGLYVDDVKVVPSSSAVAFTSPATLALFALNNNGSVMSFTKYKMHHCKIWDNNKLVRDLIPCIDENLVPFMFDTLSGAVYLNSGTGQFKVGPNVEKTWGGKKLHKKLAGVLSNLKKKRPFYTEVEYLESTNQQSNAYDALNASWIDTGIVPDDTTKMECRMAFTTLISGSSEEALCGSSGTTGNFRFAWGFASLSPFTNFYFGLGGQNLTTSVTRDTNVHTFKIDAINKTWAIDDTSGSFTSSGSLSGTSSIFLFARHIPYYGDNRANKPANAKTYYCKIWKGGRLVRDMIPVLDWNYTPCMYDKITGQLFYTKGTKQFSYGREIHYVDYLESTGTQWIDLETTINTSTDEVELYYQITGTTIYKWIFGEHETNARFGLGSGDGTDRRNVAYYNSTTKVSDSLMYNNKHHFLANTEGVFIDGTKIVNYASFSSNRYLLLFNLGEPQYDYYCAGKVWSYKHKRNGSLIRDFYPAIDENDTFFMFDKITHTAYNNAGSGSFIGPTVSKDGNGKIIENEYE